jgi:hypothetical protein
MFVSLGFEVADSVANCSSLAESRSVLAFSTGPKTRARSFDLLAFLTLDRAPLAIWNKNAVVS